METKYKHNFTQFKQSHPNIFQQAKGSFKQLWSPYDGYGMISQTDIVVQIKNKIKRQMWKTFQQMLQVNNWSSRNVDRAREIYLSKKLTELLDMNDTQIKQKIESKIIEEKLETFQQMPHVNKWSPMNANRKIKIPNRNIT